jgi:CTD small phosphatase-like protein 2
VEHSSQLPREGGDGAGVSPEAPSILGSILSPVMSFLDSWARSDENNPAPSSPPSVEPAIQPTDTPEASTATSVAQPQAMEIALPPIPHRPPQSYNLDPFLMIAQLPPLPFEYQNRPVSLPPQALHNPRPVLVLDLDETLVHCSTDPIHNPHHIFTVKFNDWNYQVFVRKRPYVEHFLEHVSKYFEITVFTASQQVYADTLLNLIDPEGKWIQHRLFRDHCVYVAGNYLKDLSILGRDLARVMIVDNSPQAFAYQLDNGIPIETWIDDVTDMELLNLIPLLDHLHQCNDVRPVLRNHFRLRELVASLANGGYHS